MTDTLSFTRAFGAIKRLVMVNGSYDHTRDEWTLVATVNGTIKEHRASTLPMPMRSTCWRHGRRSRPSR